MICPRCHTETQDLVTNVRDNTEGCWTCIAGPDRMMYRQVSVETQCGTEIYFVHALSNRDAIREFFRPGVISVHCKPLPN
jgi:hypothetical protein